MGPKPKQRGKPTLTHQNLLYCGVPLNPMLVFIIRTYKAVGFGRLRYSSCRKPLVWGGGGEDVDPGPGSCPYIGESIAVVTVNRWQGKMLAVASWCSAAGRLAVLLVSWLSPSSWIVVIDLSLFGDRCLLKRDKHFLSKLSNSTSCRRKSGNDLTTCNATPVTGPS